jgi:L-amino acid N-acyltransferase YncA
MPNNIPLEIRPLLVSDWPSVSTILQEGIATGNATFENKLPEWEEWDSTHLRDGRLVAERGGIVVGWTALTAVSGRCAYSGVAEVSVYVSSAMRRNGIGRRLLEGLIGESEKRGYWTLQAMIFPENEASITLHRKCGFRIVGRREWLGKMGDRWRDVILLERRSALAGK